MHTQQHTDKSCAANVPGRPPMAARRACRRLARAREAAGSALSALDELRCDMTLPAAVRRDLDGVSESLRDGFCRWDIFAGEGFLLASPELAAWGYLRDTVSLETARDSLDGICGRLDGSLPERLLEPEYRLVPEEERRAALAGVGRAAVLFACAAGHAAELASLLCMEDRHEGPPERNA